MPQKPAGPTMNSDITPAGSAGQPIATPDQAAAPATIADKMQAELDTLPKTPKNHLDLRDGSANDEEITVTLR
ncbi:hypothetical protein B7Z17_04490 [Candidatus Saccharibacteria bacterium 32-49-10]|nr:MAG: hypothetical protein B7Z17_04490 [Candidatus Saccharibacteria bacterium 32-49-10]